MPKCSEELSTVWAPGSTFFTVPSTCAGLGFSAGVMLGDVGLGAVPGAVPYGGAGCLSCAMAGPTTAATLSATTAPMVAERDVKRGFISLSSLLVDRATQQFLRGGHKE